MTVRQKIAVYLGLIALLIVVLSLWGYFAYLGKTDVSEFIAQLAGLVTIITSAIAALGGFHSAQSSLAAGSRASAAAALTGAAAADLLAPQQSAATPNAQSPAPLAQ